MHHQLLLILGLIFAVLMLVLLAQKIRVAYPIFLVISGLIISFIPEMPQISLEPELIFLIFLPPLLYEAAWYTSWNDFWKWKRPISLLAFGLVFFTSTVVAIVSSSIIPGFTLALGFLLGGIVSPPDAIAAATVLKGMPVPKRILTILEGESLVNDASSLIVFRFALIAIATPAAFSLEFAVGQFFWVAGMGIVVGLVIAHIMYFIHKFLPTSPAIDATLTVMTPYILYLAAEQFHFSGVMAVVTGGLFISYRSHEVFQTGATRLNMLGVWTTLIFVMNALVFILIGLELPHIIKGLGENTILEGIYYGLIISAIVILLRYIWVFPAAYVPRWLSRKIREREPSPGWKSPLTISWAGMRGVVSLATALSIPLLLDEKAFPFRNLILLITFVVIFVTLVFQGITLPFLIKFIKLREVDEIMPEHEQRAGIKIRLATVSLNHLNSKYAQETQSVEMINILKNDLENDKAIIEKKLDSMECGDTKLNEIEVYQRILLDIYKIQRQELYKLRKEKKYSDSEIRRMENQLDLEEMRNVPNANH